MKTFKIIAAAAAMLSLSACAGFAFDRPFADKTIDNTTYVSPRASMDPASAGNPGAGASGGGGAGEMRR